MTLPKRVFDIVLAMLLSVILAPVLICICVMILAQGGGPVFYRSERMKAVDQGFMLWKFRTMTDAHADAGVSGGDKSARITRLGARLRRYRLDELPQLINILRGDMSFVGPRPPLRQYAVKFPEIYQQVLQNRPGVTGLATLHIHRFEARVLADCKSVEMTDQIYSLRCIPRKARLDLIYQNHQSICFDCILIWQTIRRVFG